MLDATLATAGDDDGVDLALTVTNEGDDPVTLRFRTGQRADFAAFRTDESDGGDGEDGEDGENCGGPSLDDDPVWRYGTGRMFTQVLGSETLKPGESTTYEATWGNPPPGRYRIVGDVTAEERDLTASTVARVRP